MLIENNYRRKLSNLLICCLSSSLLIASNVLPISASVKSQNAQDFLIAKSPDERQPEAVEKGIEQIPASQASISPRRKQSIESPIQNRSISSDTENYRRSSSASNNGSGSSSSGRRASYSNANRASNSSGSSSSGRRASYSTVNRSNAGSRTVRKPTHNVTTLNNRSIDDTPAPTYKEINFVDVALGILDKKDFQSQGRYFNFYEFEGRENQLV